MNHECENDTHHVNSLKNYFYTSGINRGTFTPTTPATTDPE